MNRYLMLITAIVIAAACNDAGSDANVLAGDWGTTDIRVLATKDSTVLRTACMSATFFGPITVASDGHFSAVGTVTYTSLSNPGILHAHLAGVTSGANLMIGFYTGDPVNPPPTAEFTLTPHGFAMTIACD